MTECRLCPRDCGADRLNGKMGACGVCGANVYVARAALHFWEEPCISGTAGSGTVFFSGCPLRCVYCQNHLISRADIGKEISISRLAEIFIELEEKGAANINLVTPTHYTLQIIDALEIARARGLSLPIVYNCSGYESVETLKLVDGLIDIYLTDFKYMDSSLAKKYSKASDYPFVAKLALEEMTKQISTAKFDDKGMMQKGIIVRHMILPGYLDNSKEVIRYVYENYRHNVYISIMNQYTPLPQVSAYPEINRQVSNNEYDEIIDFAIDIGVENGFIQEGGTAKESFIPVFDYEGV